MPHALATSALVSGYDRDLPIVRGVDLKVSAGEFVVLLGPNGAGKSTLVKTIAGLVPVHSGSVVLRGEDITAAPAHWKVRHGLAFVPQTENIFGTLTIHENLQIAANILPKDAAPAGSRRSMRCFRTSARGPGKGPVRCRADSGRCWRSPAHWWSSLRLLILDEPSAGLSPKIVGEVFQRLKAINATGVTMVLVEQNVRAALAIADRAVILVEGKLAHEGAAATLADDPIVAELYLGARHGAARRSGRPP